MKNKDTVLWLDIALKKIHITKGRSYYNLCNSWCNTLYTYHLLTVTCIVHSLE